MILTTTTRDAATSCGLLILRIGAGGFLATHGWGKVQMVFEGRFDEWNDPLGIGNTISLIGAATSEFLCSILVIVGYRTRLTAIPPVFTMAVAAFIVHQNDPLTGPPPSKEAALLFMACFLALVFTGAGRFSLDGMLWGRKIVTVKT